MILNHPVIRLALKAMSACGLMIDNQHEAAALSRRRELGDPPFVLVAHAPDGRWGVFERNFEKPLAAFNELQEACDYANELARTRTGSMVLIGK